MKNLPPKAGRGQAPAAYAVIDTDPFQEDRRRLLPMSVPPVKDAPCAHPD